MPPKDITQTGPQTGTQLKQQNDEFTQYFGDYKKWASYGDLKKQGFNDSQISRIYRNVVFKSQYGARLDYDQWAKSMSPEQRDNILIMQVAPKKDLDRIPGIDIKEPTTPNNPFGPVDMQRVYDEAYQEATRKEGRPLTEKEAEAHNKQVLEEAEKRYPMYDKKEDRNAFLQAIRTLLYQEIGNPTMAILADEAIYGGTKGVQEDKAQYITDNIVVPANNNPLLNMDEAEFTRSLPQLSATYSNLAGSKWLPEKDIDYHQLYLNNLANIKAGKLYKVQSDLEKYFGNIVAKYQPGLFEGGGDKLVHSKGRVFLEQAAAGAVENLMDYALVPAGLVQGGWNALVNGDNFWEEASYLPSLAHDVAQRITGDNSQAYGNSLSSAAANSGYTIGTMAIDAALMALPTGVLKGMSRLGIESEKFLQAARAIENSKAAKIFGTASSLNFGVIEGSVDAIDVRDGILEEAKKTAMSLPEDQRAEFMKYATHEANTAYGRTMLEESLVVNAGTLLGLGFFGSLVPTSMLSMSAPKWQTNLGKRLMSGNKLQKDVSFAGKVLGGNVKLTAGELLEEFAQGMSSGINKARANYNINNYATALHYGLGAEYLTNTQLGFMQGLERFTPQAWAEMDPENLTKQVLLSTMLFRSLHMPGMGKTRAQIDVDNNTMIGKIWDNIRKFSPVQTGIGQVIADAKSDVFDIENSLENGFRALIQNGDVQEVLQTQAALTDIGIQMQDALNKQDIGSYQKLAAAYQVALAVMLATARVKNTRFGKNYEQVLSNRANFDNLSAEDKQKVLANYLDELQINTIKQLPQEEQIKVMKETAQRALDLTEKASAAFEKLSQNGEFLGEDIRPLVFAEVLNESIPSTIEENWSTLQPLLQEVFSKSQFKDVNPEALKYVKAKYFDQSNFADRADALASFFSEKPKNPNITKEDVKKAFEAVVTELEKLKPDAETIINNDFSLIKWQSDIYKEWSDLYQQIKRGEGALSKKQVEAILKVERVYARLGLNKKEKDYAERIKQSNGSVGHMASIMDQMISDEEIGKERAVQIAFTQVSPEAIQEALKTLDAVRDLKDTLQRVIPDDSPVKELLPRLFDYIDSRVANVTSSKEVLKLETYSSLNNPALQALMAYAISEVGTQESVPVTDTPVTEHNKEDLDAGTSTDASTEPEQEGTPLPNDETFEERAPSTEQEVPEHQASAQVQEIEKWDSEISTIGDALNNGSLDPTTAGNQLYSIKQELKSLYKTVSGDELRSRVKKDIDRATELIKIALALSSAPSAPITPVGKKRRVIKTPYWEGLKAFKKDIVRYFIEARKAKRVTTPEEFVATFWNPSYENFEAVKDAFMELLPSDNRTEEAAKDLFADYFISHKKLKTNRKGYIDISANEIVRRVLGIISEEEAIKLVGGMSFKEYEDMLTADLTAILGGLPIDNAQYVTPEGQAKMQARDKISALIKEKKVIIDDTGDLVDAEVKWVARKLKNGELPKRKNAIKLSKLLDTLESTYGSADWTGIIQNFASYGLPRYKELVRDEYNSYLSNSGVLDEIDKWQRADEEALDEMVLNEYFDELDELEREISAQFLEELSKPVAIQIRLGNSEKIYDYATTDLDYEPGQTFQVVTPYGPTTATVVSYGKPVYSGTLKDLSTIIVPTRKQAERKLQQFNDESKKRKHKDAVQNAFTSDTSRIAETHSEVLDVLKKAGAAQFIMRGNLHEGDELGFVLGTWQSPDGARPVVYIVTKKTYEHGSNDNPLFKGHQVIGVLDTDSATSDSKIYTEVNEIRQGLSNGDYFELKSNPLVVSNVSTSGVKVKSIVGETRDSEAVDKTNLNKVLDSNNGAFGIEYDGKVAPIVLISNRNGAIQSSDPNYDLKQLFDPSKSAEENAKRLIGNKADAALPENVTLMIVPTPSGDTAQLVVYAVDDTIEDFQSRLNNMLTNSPIGDAIKQNLKEKLVQLWRKSKGANVENIKFSLGTYFRLNGEGIVVTYFGGQFRFSLGKDTPLFAVPFDMADLGLASKSVEDTEKLFDTTTVIDDCWNALLSGLTNPAQTIIRAVNLDVNNIASNPDILQQLIAAGALYVPNAVTGEDGKITLQNASFTAYTEDTKPVEKVSTKSKDATTPVISPNDNSSLVQQTESSSVISQPSTQPKSEGVSEDNVTPRSIISPRRKKKLKMSREISREPLESPNTNTSSVKSNTEISTLPYQEAIKHADITMDEATWNSLSGIEKLQYLNCK